MLNKIEIRPKKFNICLNTVFVITETHFQLLYNEKHLRINLRLFRKNFVLLILCCPNSLVISFYVLNSCRWPCILTQTIFRRITHTYCFDSFSLFLDILCALRKPSLLKEKICDICFMFLTMFVTWHNLHNAKEKLYSMTGKKDRKNKFVFA